MRLFTKIKLFLRRILGKNALYYICGNGALPMPLSKEEERVALEMIKNGEERYRSVLIEHNLRLVVYIAKKFENTGCDTEDLVSVGCVGLIKAVNSFDPQKNIKLATYASRCIENEILMHLRKTVKRKAELSLEEPLNTDSEGNELLLSDVLGTSPEEVYENIESQVETKLLYDAYEKLSQKEKYIMKMRFGLFGIKEMTQKEVADTLGISQSYISRLEKKILSKMKKEFDKLA